MVPRVAFQVTAVFVVAPCTVAENGSVLLTIAEAVAGEIVMELTAGAAAAPVPCSGTMMGLALALVMIVRVPLTLPEVVGSNITLKFWLWPGERVKGGVMPDMVKPVPAMLT
jgi:hypothetical protein